MNLVYMFYSYGVVTMYNYSNAVSGAANGAFYATYVSI